MAGLRVLVAGGGAAGMMAAISAAQVGASVLLLEKTESLGFKLRISGGGRCNVTNAKSEVRELISWYPGGGRFLRDALRRYTKDDLLALLARHGIKTKIEPPFDKVFPASNRAQDVVDALTAELAALGVKIRFNSAVTHLRVEQGRVMGVCLANGEFIAGDRAIVAMGGKSFSRSGTCGDGFRLARELGHQVAEPFPSLVPLRVAGTKPLAGVAIRNVAGTAIIDGEPRGPSFRGDMLFTHFGISGPVVLQLSRAVAEGLRRNASALVRFDLLPDLTFDNLGREIQDRARQAGRRNATALLDDWTPKAAATALLAAAGLTEMPRAAELTRSDRHRLVKTLKGWSFPVTGWHSFDGAEVTAGGVVTKEINPQTMESRLITGLFWAGEVVDIDGYLGGYNLQAAWSTGYVAGKSAATCS